MIKPQKKKINAKAKGSGFERQLAKLMRSLGFINCTTSRFSSKEKDDAGIDLCGTDPLFIQAKAVEQKLDYHAIIDRMPRRKGDLNLVFHKRSRRGVVVAMKQEDFLEILQMLLKRGIIKP